jgi:plastocyanin
MLRRAATLFTAIPAALAALTVLALAAPTPIAAETVSGRVLLVENGTPRRDASNTIVWIEGVHRGSAVSRGEMKSSTKRFLPRVVAVSREATVEFPNVDPIYHNVFSVSGGNRFDLGLYRSGVSKSKKFEESGLVRVYCNIHPQMVGFVMVVDSDAVAVTGPDGSFRFEGVPAGAHVLHAWHEEGGEIRLPLSAGAADPLTIRIDVSGFRPEPHKNKYGKDYPPNAGESDDERY